jgi:hypothetical protein
MTVVVKNGEISVNQVTRAEQFKQQIAPLVNGRFLVTWSDWSDRQGLGLAGIVQPFATLSPGLRAQGMSAADFLVV